jgi:hypothetical protein
MAPRFPLRIKLIPKDLWGRNLRSHKVGLGPYRWLKMSREIRAELGRCSICGSKKKLHGHEVWKLTEKLRSGIATLVKVNTICTVCHSFKHWGRTSFLIMAGVMSLADGERLIRHFMKVNGCTKSAFKRHSDRAFTLWRARSQKKWKVDWGPFKLMVEEAEALVFRDARFRFKSATKRGRKDR